MAQIAATAVKTLEDLLRAPTGLSQGLAAVSAVANQELPRLGDQQIVAQNVAAELAERTTGATYPTYYLYCEKLSNTLREKFRQFSGTASMAVEVRVTHDRLEGLAQRAQLYIDALTESLDASRGDWGNGQFYTGGYQITFGPVKQGGKHFVQTAKATFEVQISK
jgi:hypothetical protein